MSRWIVSAGLSSLALISGCSLFAPAPDPLPSPVATNPAALRIAILAPEALKLPSSGVTMTVFQQDPAGKTITSDYNLVAVSDPTEAQGLSAAVKPGQVVHVLRLRPADALDLREQQADMAAVRAGGGDVRPGFSVGLDRACWKGGSAEGAAPVNILIEGDNDSGFHPLVADIDIAALLARPAGSGLKSCKS
ncbi:hypothetical protein FJU08_20070 [Martelella alba]|uniref:Lipoprotein n=1 Tax=Martelella alba TaxID=2590451 RepID=A0A506U3A8_9HYPH|nr:hypothetical protein [Martelella alba]TPW27514.1 hypothetical protein FJU08_20070 [Martelella alba]